MNPEMTLRGVQLGAVLKNGAGNQGANSDLLHAARQVLWKLSHNHSASGNGDDCKPGTIDRNDATIKLLAAAVAKATGGAS